jgi:hypothetical protein
MLGFAFVCTTFVLVPLLKAIRYTPGIESGANHLLRFGALPLPHISRYISLSLIYFIIIYLVCYLFVSCLCCNGCCLWL